MSDQPELPVPPVFYTRRTVAKMLDMSPITLAAKIKEGLLREIEGARVGKRITHEEYVRFVTEQFGEQYGR